jgi:hypothetical protein
MGRTGCPARLWGCLSEWSRGEGCVVQLAEFEKGGVLVTALRGGQTVAVAWVTGGSQVWADARQVWVRGALMDRWERSDAGGRGPSPGMRTGSRRCDSWAGRLWPAGHW